MSDATRFAYNPITDNMDLVNQGGAGGDVSTITGDSGGAVGPNDSGNINLLGNELVQVVGTPGSNTQTLTPTSAGWPITPYVVGPEGFGGYQDVPSAVAAAALAGSGLICVQPGSWNIGTLTIPSGVNFMGGDYWSTELVGSLIPPNGSPSTFSSIRLTSATNIFDTSDALSLILTFNNCLFTAIDGYAFNIPDCSGSIKLNNCMSDGTDDGFLNNQGGCNVVVNSSRVGGGTNFSITSDGPLSFNDSDVDCPGFVEGATSNSFSSTIFRKTLVIAESASAVLRSGCYMLESLVTGDDAIVSCIDSDFSGAEQPPVQHGSSNPLVLCRVSIDTLNPLAIVGAGINEVVLAGVNFLGSSGLSGVVVTYSDKLQVGALESSSYVKGYRPMVTQASNATFALTDANTFQLCTQGTTQTMTVPANASVPFNVDTEIEIWQNGAGQVVIAPAVGVTIRSQFGNLKIGVQYSGAFLKKIGTNEWILAGNLTA